VALARSMQQRRSTRGFLQGIGRLMHGLGWTAQRPERRALERDEGKIERWKQEDWPLIKKTPLGWVPRSSLPMNRASC
jgi:hypothetical protein